ncbi:MAG: YaiI/YqxD family protein [Halanaerobiaceae bacterium]
MRILIDGDACPVISVTEEIAKAKGIKVIIFTDITHQINTENELIVLDKANQSVDMAIFNHCMPGDIVVTQDYGLASLVLNKGAKAINQSGMVYTEDNIDYLLMKRHIHARMRRAGVRHLNMSKRTIEDDQNYRKSLLKLIENV